MFAKTLGEFHCCHTHVVRNILVTSKSVAFIKDYVGLVAFIKKMEGIRKMKVVVALLFHNKNIND